MLTPSLVTAWWNVAPAFSAMNWKKVSRHGLSASRNRSPPRAFSSSTLITRMDLAMALRRSLLRLSRSNFSNGMGLSLVRWIVSRRILYFDGLQSADARLREHPLPPTAVVGFRSEAGHSERSFGGCEYRRRLCAHKFQKNANYPGGRQPRSGRGHAWGNQRSCRGASRPHK